MHRATKKSFMQDRPLYGRDALFQAERLRKDFWRHHQERGELLAYKEHIAQGQKRAEYTNEVRRIEGFLQHDQTYGARRDYLKGNREQLLKKLGMDALPD